MINSLRLRNFKGIRRADVDLERLTVIVGPNASGKTSFLEALDMLDDLKIYDQKEIFINRRDPVFLYSQNAYQGAPEQGMELSCYGDETNILLRILAPHYFRFGLDRMKPGSAGWQISSEYQRAGQEGDDWGQISESPGLSLASDHAILLRLDPSELANPSDGTSTRMNYQGRGMASALAFMALNQPDEFQEVQRRLRTVVPSIERIRFEPVPLEGKDFLGYQILLDFQGARGIPAHQGSEGTILVLGLLTALMSDENPRLVLLDDVDRGLHPKAQRGLLALLRTMMEQNPELQIVATTHSPYLVDCLRPEEVRLTTLGDDGAVSIASLVEHPDFDKWKDEMAPGEMWSLFGEKWVGELQRDSVEK